MKCSSSSRALVRTLVKHVVLVESLLSPSCQFLLQLQNPLLYTNVSHLKICTLPTHSFHSAKNHFGRYQLKLKLERCSLCYYQTHCQLPFIHHVMLLLNGLYVEVKCAVVCWWAFFAPRHLWTYVSTVCCCRYPTWSAEDYLCWQVAGGWQDIGRLQYPERVHPALLGSQVKGWHDANLR